MHTYLKQSAAVASVLAFSTVSTFAGTISTAQIVETTRDFGGLVSTTVTTDEVVDGDASVNTGLGDSVATQNADGTSAVRATVGFNAPEELTTSTASFQQSETNATAGSRDYTLNYTLAEQTADLFWFGGFDLNLAATTALKVAPSIIDNPFGENPNALPATPSRYTAASFEYGIRVGKTEVFSARADALLDGFGLSNAVLDAVSGFTPTLFSNNNGGVTFTVAPLSGSIFLGSYAAGTDVEVTSFLRARAYSTGFGEGGGSVDILSSDPITLSSIGSLTSIKTPTVSTVPLPAAGWLLIAGLGGLAAMRRPKS
jgi:hypothetical protein